jgi:hypothetical protein
LGCSKSPSKKNKRKKDEDGDGDGVNEIEKNIKINLIRSYIPSTVVNIDLI